jgi:hypothetical protein
MFTKVFFIQALETAVKAGVAAFLVSPFITAGVYTVKGFVGAAIVAGVAALTQFAQAYAKDTPAAKAQAKADAKKAK